MKLGQIDWQGQLTAAILEGDQARPIPGMTVAGLIAKSDVESKTLAEIAQSSAGSAVPCPQLRIPVQPAEVWGSGCTYEQSASFRDGEYGTREGFYAYVYRQEHRPELFLKGTSRICCGPDDPIGMRPDSKFTAPEPELAIVLGAKGHIVGFTLANDVSAWDIERENPLYLPQSKTFTGCCSLGPWIVTADEMTDPYALDMTCTIERKGQTLFKGETSTSRLNRKLETLVEYLMRGNPVPSTTVLVTGTGIIVTEESALAEGDIVSISVAGFGTLRNPVARLAA